MEKLLDTVVGTMDENNTIDNHIEYRKQQVKLVYALVNIDSCDSKKIVERITKTILEYEEKQEFEIELLHYLWLHQMGEYFCVISGIHVFSGF